MTTNATPSAPDADDPQAPAATTSTTPAPEATGEADVIKAKASRAYVARLAIFSLAFTLFGLWGLYDGLVAYPESNQRYDLYQTFKDEPSEVDGDGVILEQAELAWQAEAESRGWPIVPPKDRYGAGSFVFQFVIAGVCIPVGLLVGVMLIRYVGRWVAVDAEGLHASFGVRVPWDAIQQVDKTRWRSKGIAVIRYSDADAQIDQAFILDDWKFEREPTERILAVVEQHVTPDQIHDPAAASESTEAPVDPGEPDTTPDDDPPGKA